MVQDHGLARAAEATLKVLPVYTRRVNRLMTQGSGIAGTTSNVVQRRTRSHIETHDNH